MSIWQNSYAKTGNHIEKFSGLVIDASVAVKWFSEEADSDVAANYLNAISAYEFEAFAPSVLVYEVGNALFKGKHQDQRRISISLSELLKSPIEFVHMNFDYLDFAVDFMVRYDLSFYDAVYAGLAKKLNLPLLTANPKDHNKVKEIKIFTLK